MKYRIAVVDDNPSSIQIILDYIKTFSQETGEELSVITHSDGDEITENFKCDFDIIFLDVEMKRLDGMKTAEYIRNLDKNVIIIFITNMSQYAIKGYAVDALSYLLKPLPYFAFSQELKRSIEKIKSREHSYILLPTDNGVERYEMSEILYVESMKHKLMFKTAKNNIKITGTMKETEEKFSKHNFFRCNNCYLVNLAKVRGVKDNCAIVDDDLLQISRPRKKAFMQALTAFLGGV